MCVGHSVRLSHPSFLIIVCGLGSDVNLGGGIGATNCFAGTANGPTAGDCSVIASAILYESQSVG